MIPPRGLPRGGPIAKNVSGNHGTTERSMKVNSSKANRRGFTLIDVLLVILLLGMLATVAIVAIGGTRDKARKDITKVLVQQTVPNALDRYNNDIGHYPTEEEGGLDALRKKPSFGDDEKLGEKWVGYLTKEPKDAWGNALTYEVVEDAEAGAPKYKLWSNGPNGQSGDDDDIKSVPDEEET
jgi:general secretion pathway protein G